MRPLVSRLLAVAPGPRVAVRTSARQGYVRACPRTVNLNDDDFLACIRLINSVPLLILLADDSKPDTTRA